MKFYGKEKLGSKRRHTPEGYLVIENTPIGRTGEMVYGPGEFPPAAAGRDGLLRAHRTADHLFKPETLASFAGKPLVDDHPKDDVTPMTWNNLAVGIVMHPRRGEGDQHDLMLADIMVTNHKAIKAIDAGKVELSCGYDYDLEWDSDQPGIAEQTNIIGNHVALVERGRCGARCAIGDTTFTPEKKIMATKTHKPGVLARIRAALKANDNAALASAVDEAEEALEQEGDDNEIHVHLHGGDQIGDGTESAGRVNGHGPGDDDDDDEDGNEMIPAGMAAAIGVIVEQAIAKAMKGKVANAAAQDELSETQLAALEDEMPAGQKARDVMKGRDCACLGETFQTTAASAEILAPGLSIPVFDSNATPAAAIAITHKLRRTAIDLAYNQPATRGIIEQALAGKPFDLATMSESSVRSVFITAAALKKAANNRGGDTDLAGRQEDVKKQVGLARSVHEINEINKKHYGLNA